jgi:dihydroorotase
VNARPECEAETTYDLLIKDGTILDPMLDVSGQRADVAIRGSLIAHVGHDIPEDSAERVIRADGCYVVPGLIDIHVHVFDAVTPIGIPADPNCVAKGVTTVVDAGSAGAHNFPGFKQYSCDAAATRVRALLNVSTLGMVAHSVANKVSEVADFRYMPIAPAIRTIERNRDLILGVKLRLMPDVEGGRDIDALKIAREIADAVDLPLMLHYVNRPYEIRDVLGHLGPGDILTHCFHGHKNGVLDERGRVKPEVREAVDRGVRLDVGHGWVSFSYEVAEKAIADGLLPTTISTDLHHYCVLGPVFDLPTLMSKFLDLGLSLEQVIERTTTSAASSFQFEEEIGTLRDGAVADVAVLELVEGDFRFVDCHGNTRNANQKLRPVASVRDGAVHGTGARTGLAM